MAVVDFIRTIIPIQMAHRIPQCKLVSNCRHLLNNMLRECYANNDFFADQMPLNRLLAL